MRKLLSMTLILLLATISLQAQDAKKDLKKASRLLGSYQLDPANNKGDIREAKTLIESVLKSEEFANDTKAWTTKGQINNELALSDFKMLAINQSHVPVNKGAAVEAYNAFKMGLKTAEKGYQQKDALNGMSETATYLNPLGLVYYQSGEFPLAYEHFSAVLDIHNMLTENDMKTPLATDDDYNNQLYITGLCALNMDNADAAKDLFTELKDRGYDKPVVYEGLFKVYQKSDPDKAGMILTEGREKFPDDPGLLFAEINYYLQKGEMNKLISRLEQAIEKEPNNASIYTTLGSVYDNLYQNAELHSDKSNNYFDKAKENYEKALEVKPGDFTATYSIGALYYNKAAKVVDEMNELANDLSKEGMKKYDAKKAEMEKLFDIALPYFKEAESMDPDDKNTIIALKEIYARKGDIEKSNEYKNKLEGM